MGNRFAYGITPALNRRIVAAGGPRPWFTEQLNPQAIPDADAEAMDRWWGSINADYDEIWDRDRTKVESGWEAMANYARWCLLRRIYSHRQVLEVMAEFWENHLYIPVHDDGVFTYRASFGKMLRDHALGRFDDMLYAATTHPAMGISLDNANSTRRGVNENHGRELLELHTVGQGNYTEDDVKGSAHVLTGYRVETWRTWHNYYDPAAHVTGPIKVMGFSHSNTDPDGRVAVRAYLRYLAHHPATAKRIAHKLAVRFVADNPSPGLVERLAEVYLTHETAIKPVLLALVDSDEFARSAGKKVRTPTDELVATHRVLETQIRRPTGGKSAANAILWQAANLGQMPFDWPRPDGPPDRADAWTGASRMLASFGLHWGMAGGWWPTQDISYRPRTSWVPQKGMRFDQLVDHLSRVLLGRVSTGKLLQACCQATQTRPGERLTVDHPVLQWRMPLVLATVLDTPDHLCR